MNSLFITISTKLSGHEKFYVCSNAIYYSQNLIRDIHKLFPYEHIVKSTHELTSLVRHDCKPLENPLIKNKGHSLPIHKTSLHLLSTSLYSRSLLFSYSAS